MKILKEYCNFRPTNAFGKQFHFYSREIFFEITKKKKFFQDIVKKNPYFIGVITAIL